MTDKTVPLDDYSFYANVFSYMGLPLSRDLDDSSVDAVIMGVPYDLATSGRAGTRSGPQAIRQVSANMVWEEKRWPWDFALSEKLKAIDYGDVQYMFGDSDDMLQQTEEQAAAITAAGKTLVSFGGDLFVTLPLLRGHARTHGKLALIHFDAHTGSYQEEEKYSHGCMFYHAPREGLIDPARSVQVGIRTDYDRSTHEFQVIDAHQANEQSVQETVAAIRERVGDHPAYLTFDIDCLDPAYAPGTGTPVCGGLSSFQALEIIRGLSGINLVGMDVVEVAPAYDVGEVTALAAAVLASEILCLYAVNPH